MTADPRREGAGEPGHAVTTCGTHTPWWQGCCLSLHLRLCSDLDQRFQAGPAGTRLDATMVWPGWPLSLAPASGASLGQCLDASGPQCGKMLEAVWTVGPVLGAAGLGALVLPAGTMSQEWSSGSPWSSLPEASASRPL